VLPPQKWFYEASLIKVHTTETKVIDIPSTLSKMKRKRKVSTDGVDVPKTPATMQRAISKTLEERKEERGRPRKWEGGEMK
jgi:hypothetical protein